MKDSAPLLRAVLAAKNDRSEVAITVLRTLDGLGILIPKDVEPFLRHADPAVRIHALQLGDKWFGTDQGVKLEEATFAAAAAEKNPRVQIQFALSLGESRDRRAFELLARPGS